MILPDVNILVYAFRRDTPHHAICREWLEEVVRSVDRFGISPLVLSAVARIVTDRRFYGEPSSLDDVFRFTDNLLGQPHSVVVEPGARHWTIFRQLCTATGMTGARISDVWYAALAMEWDCEWVTADDDFRRFPGLKWRLLR